MSESDTTTTTTPTKYTHDALYNAVLLCTDDYNNKLKNYTMLISLWACLLSLQLVLAALGLFHQALAFTIIVFLVAGGVRATDQCDLCGENMIKHSNDTAFTSALRSRRAISLDGVRDQSTPLWKRITTIVIKDQPPKDWLALALHELLVDNVQRQ